MITLFQALGINVGLIILLMILGYVFREGIKNFFSEKILEKQKEHNEARDKKQQEFERELSKQNADLQKEIQDALEKQRIEFQKELKVIDYKNDYYKKILDKRINAYAELNDLILNAILISKVDNYEYHTLFSNYEEFLKNYNRLKMLGKNFIWYSFEIVELLNKYVMVFSSADSYYRGSTQTLNIILNQLNLDLEHVVDIENTLKNIALRASQHNVILPFDDAKLCSVGIICRNMIGDLQRELIIKLQSDFKKLYEVEEFLNQKSK